MHAHGFLKYLVMLPLAASLQVAMAADAAGVVKTAKGNARIERGGQVIAASVGAELLASDRVVTGADSSLGLTLKDNTMLSVGPNSVMELNRFSFNSTTHDGALDASLKRGTLAVISGKIAKANPDAVRFSSPTVSLGVRGTEFIMEAGEGVQ